MTTGRWRYHFYWIFFVFIVRALASLALWAAEPDAFDSRTPQKSPPAAASALQPTPTNPDTQQDMTNQKGRFNVAPMFYFEVAPRHHPNRVNTLRFGGAAQFDYHLSPQFGFGLAAHYATGREELAGIQLSSEEKAYRGRFGPFYRFGQDELFGVRAGVQYSYFQYSITDNSSSRTSQLRPAFWAPYVGFELQVIPLHSGFGVREQITISYDPFFESMTYQMALGIVLH